MIVQVFRELFFGGGDANKGFVWHKVNNFVLRIDKEFVQPYIVVLKIVNSYHESVFFQFCIYSILSFLKCVNKCIKFVTNSCN